MLKVAIDSFRYPNQPDESVVLKSVDFTLPQGNTVCILGESGCGKSTLLHLIYGLLELEFGRISYNSEPLFGPSQNLVPGHPFMKLVSQVNTLMPYTTVKENVATYLDRIDTHKDNERVEMLLEIVGLQKFANAKVKHLSGGQIQRISIAQALAKKPKILLLDEPFSSIDSFKKNTLRRVLFNYLKEENISCITATHDAEEALSYADEIILIKNGEIDLKGTPEKVYRNAKTIRQRSFFGEVSVIPKGVVSNKELLLYPHQLKISNGTTGLKVTLVKSFFKGHYFLNEGVLNDTTIYFISDKRIKEATVYLDVENI